MIKKIVGGVHYLQFELLADEPGLVHGVLLRSSLSSTDEKGWGDPDKGKDICDLFQIDHCQSIYQVHGSTVHCLDDPKELPNGDGIITRLEKVGLMIRHADCQAAIFYDPVRRVLANVHSGWRGNVLNIYQEAIAKMRSAYGCNPSDILVAISPSLGPDHSEFIHYEKEFPEQFWSFQIRPTYFDLWAIARHQLEEAGILPHHIQIASQCTYADSASFYSYRRDKIKGRNNATIAALIP